MDIGTLDSSVGNCTRSNSNWAAKNALNAIHDHLSDM
jgi:hypothetical protein